MFRVTKRMQRPGCRNCGRGAVTKKIRLATGICLVVERDPIHTAKEVSTLDRLSAGRLQRLPVDLNQDGFRRAG